MVVFRNKCNVMEPLSWVKKMNVSLPPNRHLVTFLFASLYPLNLLIYYMCAFVLRSSADPDICYVKYIPDLVFETGKFVSDFIGGCGVGELSEIWKYDKMKF